jgi:hypothetical protein
MITSPWLPGLLVLFLGSVPTRGDGVGGKVSDPSHTRDAPKILVKALADDEDGLAEIRATPGYKAAYRKGVDEAKASLKGCRAQLFSHGMFGMSDLDPETGLSVVPIAGCVVTEEVLGRTEGNNGHVRAWVKEHGPTPNALVRWTDELSNLPAFFAARVKAGATIPLRIGGPTLTSPDGRFTLRQVAARVKKGTPPDVRTVTTVGLEVSERGAVRVVLTDDWGDGLTDLAWGPPGAPFAVVKTRGDGSLGFQVLHLRPVDWVLPRKLAWQRYLKEHPDYSLNKPD